MEGKYNSENLSWSGSGRTPPKGRLKHKKKKKIQDSENITPSSPYWWLKGYVTFTWRHNTRSRQQTSQIQLLRYTNKRNAVFLSVNVSICNHSVQVLRVEYSYYTLPAEDKKYGGKKEKITLEQQGKQLKKKLGKSKLNRGLFAMMRERERKE